MTPKAFTPKPISTSSFQMTIKAWLCRSKVGEEICSSVVRHAVSPQSAQLLSHLVRFSQRASHLDRVPSVVFTDLAGFSVLDHGFESSRTESDASPVLVHDGREDDLCRSPDHHYSRQLAVDKFVVQTSLQLLLNSYTLSSLSAASALLSDRPSRQPYLSSSQPSWILLRPSSTLSIQTFCRRYLLSSAVLSIIAPPPASKEQPSRN
ncbi:hypothetical protein BLNAU_10649 [Blattamonas nauphoetae]|uniref:Uncharacterized protein n=1 Tax=Blattamonas nauphoetae TaxID=2049346 RepID=A0ABQ9XRT8_9EUKA|nr:hypothetical protein BLNAU_10649 [Blattamonas nauphoetae]